MEGRADLEVRMLGGFAVAILGRAVAVDRWRLRKARSIVKLLALAPGARITRERAMDVLWPDLDPDAADNNLRQTLHVARRALDPDPASTNRWLSLRGDQLALCPEGTVWVDATAFVAAVSLARPARDTAALQAALALYGGDLLPEDAYEDWTAARREEIHETYLAALMELARANEDAGRDSAAIAAFERAVVAAPSLEEAHVGLMRLHARAGDRRRAVQQFELLERALREELDAAPDPASVRLRADIQAGRVSAGQRAQSLAPSHNLPAQLTTFIGRDRERESIADHLRTDRLVTLTGPGGSGKTRLAISVAEAALQSGEAESVSFADLAPIADASLVADVVARALGGSISYPSLTAALTRLGDAKALVVLDNCEHVLGGVAAAARAILDRCPRVRVIATSRQSLGVVGERIVEVPPLGIPVSVEQARSADAVRLFLDRVRLARPTFVLNERTTRAVVEICRRLDGLPLAIELAAAQLRVLSLEELERRIDDRFRVLVGGGTDRPPRHQTLRAAIDWSYEQLPSREQLVFERLSVFRGPWDARAAEAIVADVEVPREEVSGVVGSLVDRSLVAVESRDDGSVRYRMLDTIRDYARGRLAEHDGADQVALRHADHFIAYAEERKRSAQGGADPRRWLQLLYEAGEELRSAFQTILSRRDRDRAMRFGAAMVTYYMAVGNVAEGTRLLEDALALDDGRPSVLRARLLASLGSVRRDLGDRLGARQAFEEAIGIGRTLRDRTLLAVYLSTLGGMLVPEDSPDAERLLDEAAALREGLPDEPAFAVLHWNRANLARARGDLAAARGFYERGRAMAARIGAVREECFILHSLGTLSHVEGDLAAARRIYEECLAVARELDDWWLLILVLGSLGRLELQEGRPERSGAFRREALEKAHARQERGLIAGLVEDSGIAAVAQGRTEGGLRLFASGAAWHRSHGVIVVPAHPEAAQGWLEAATDALGPDIAHRALEEGRSLTLERAVAEILEDDSSS